jgi:hypothetical protein
MDLKRISAEFVQMPLSSIWRFLGVPAYRCEPCRHKYFSILPMRRQAQQEQDAYTVSQTD